MDASHSVFEIDSHICSLQHRLSLLPLSHPQRPHYLRDLAVVRFKHYNLSHKKEDLDKTILDLTEGLLLLRTTRPSIKTVVRIFHSLTDALFQRWKDVGEPEDIKHATSYLRYLRNQAIEAFNIPHTAVTTSLIETLAAGVKSEIGNETEDIDEIVVLCRELISNTSAGYLPRALPALTEAVLAEYHRKKQIKPLDQAIECLREASRNFEPSLHKVSLDLADVLSVRFLALHTNNDYEEANSLIKAIASHSPGGRPGLYHSQASALALALEHARAIVYSNSDDLGGAISRCRSFLSHSSSFGNILHPTFAALLASFADQCSEHTMPMEDTVEDGSESEDQRPLSPELGTFEDGDYWQESDFFQTTASLTVVEEEIERLKQLLSVASQGTDRQRWCLQQLAHWYKAKVYLTGDIADIEDAVRYHRIFLDSIHPSDPSTFRHLSSFASLLLTSFKKTGRTEYLDESITHYRDILRLEIALPTYFAIIRRLIGCLSIRRRLHGQKKDLDEIMNLFALGVRDTFATTPDRFELACHWAKAARNSKHHSVSTAYEHVIPLMQRSLVFSPTLSSQHDRLLEKRHLYEKIPMDFASFLIRQGQLKRAIEILEQGRTLLWSELYGLRTSTDQIRMRDSRLAQRLAEVNLELETITTSTIQTEGSEGLEQFHRLLVKQQKLLEEQDALISQVRDLPGFENFLIPLSFDTLSSAASHGPVIIINHSIWGSDIIIILHDSPPTRIPTPHNFFDRVNRLQEALCTARQTHDLASRSYGYYLSRALADLYELVGHPVIKRLKELGIPEQSRVWWCPTSIFGYLPLHALGPIPSDDGVRHYFLDLYIPSYTPTLSALITSRRPGAQISTRPTSLLLVGVVDAFMPAAYREILNIQSLNLQVTSLIGQRATLSAVLDALRHHAFCHFSTHTQSSRGPFDVSFRLHNGSLTLLEIVRSRFPAGEFAFLSSCQTAELSEKSIPDEALHVSAAIQYSGFRSVIGTMWAMADIDGPDLSDRFYRMLFNDTQGIPVPYYERSATALTHAVRKLRRKKGMSIERWVNFIHFGA